MIIKASVDFSVMGIKDGRFKDLVETYDNELALQLAKEIIKNFKPDENMYDIGYLTKSLTLEVQKIEKKDWLC